MVLVDELLAQCQVSPGALHVVLLELELAGRLQRGPGNTVCLLAAETSLELELTEP
jgi:DNA processing protein